jgi:hypothetical protein
MANEWDEFEDATQETQGWDAFEDIDQTEVMVQPDPPGLTKSEMVARDLMFIDIPAGFGTVAKVGYDMARESLAGLAGIVGAASAAVPGGEKPSERGPRYVEGVRNFLPEWHPKDEGIQLGQEMLGKAMDPAIQAVKKTGSPAAYAGARLAGASPEEASLSMQDFMETPNALGEGMFQVTRSPTLAVVAQLLPELATAGMVPAKKPPLRPRPDIAPDMPPSGFGGIGEVDDVVAATTRRPDPRVPEKEVFDRIREALRRGDKEALAAEINANPAIVAAFDELGIEFTPGMVSESMPIRQVEAALGSAPDSGIPRMHKYVETELNAKAKELIDESGGRAGRPSDVAGDIETRFNETHSNYLKAEEAIWDDLNKQIPRGAEIDMKNVAEQLEDTASRLGKGDIDLGISRMSKHEKELWGLTHRKVKRLEDPNNPESNVIEVWDYEPPPWEAIDRFRRRLGLGLEKRGPFTDAEMGELKNWYGQMAEQQTRFAKGNNYEANWDRMNGLTQERKALEEAMIATLGRGLNSSVLTKLSSAANALIKGDVKKWDALFESLPADMRQAAAAQALENVFFTAGKGEKMSANWLNNFEKIKRDPALQSRLFDELPMEARAEFMRLGEAAGGFYRMMDRSLSNPSGTAMHNYVLNRLQQPDFLIGTIIGRASEAATNRVPFIRQWVQELAGRTPEAKAGAAAERLSSAANMLSDPALHRAIIEYAAGNVERANQILRGSQSWLRWVKSRPLPQQERFHTAGIAALFEETEE